MSHQLRPQPDSWKKRGLESVPAGPVYTCRLWSLPLTIKVGGPQDGEMESSQVCFENLLVGPGGQVQGLAQWSSTLLML